MKKVLAVAVAFVLLIGMIPFAGAAFTDEDKISSDNKKAVEYVSGKGVISGFPDGSFKPTDTLTRAQAAKILCVALEGADAANALAKTDTGFSDVPATHWAAKFIAYCVDKGVVAGVGNNKFNPDGKLTGTAFAKMLLVAFHRADASQLVGEKWAVNTQKAMRTDALNDGVNTADKPTTRENACRMAYNFLLDADIAAVEPEAYKQTTIPLTGSGKYRLLGRALQTANGVVCDCSADGIEFTVECKGTIMIKANSSWKGTNNIAYRVIVDGVPGDQVKVTTAKQDFDLAGQIRVLPGLHTIRIVKDYEITQSTDLIKSIELLCKPDTMKPTQPKKKLLHVIGDSTSAGFGILTTNTPTTTQNSASAIYTYGYKSAEALDMDYEMIVKGTSGVVKQYANANGRPCNQQEIYEYQNPYRDENTHYNFARKADAAVIKFSGNDNSVPAEELEAGMRALIGNIRKHNGESTPVVLLYYSNSKHKATAEKLIAEDPLVYGVIGVSDGKGMGSHPSKTAHNTMTERLVEVLRPLVN